MNHTENIKQKRNGMGDAFWQAKVKRTNWAFVFIQFCCVKCLRRHFDSAEYIMKINWWHRQMNNNNNEKKMIIIIKL